MKQYTYLSEILCSIHSLDDLCARIEKYKLCSQDIADFLLVYWFERNKDLTLSESVNAENFSLRFDYYSRKHYLSKQSILQAIKRQNRKH